MRTLQEKYNGIQEGKFSKEHFLADARMELPNLVTRFNGYDDAVQILKNKGMIQEASMLPSFSRLVALDAIPSYNNKTNKIVKFAYDDEGTNQFALLDLVNKKVIVHGASRSSIVDKFPKSVTEAKKEEGRKVTDHPFIVYTDKKGKHQLDEFNYEDDLKAFCKTIPNTWDVYKTKKEALAELRRRLKENPEKFIKEARITEVKDLYSYKVGDQVKFTNGEIWKVAKPGVKGSKVFLAPFNDIAKKGHISLAIEFSADELKDTVNEAKLTKKSLTDYRYKPTNDMDKYPYEQILRGIRVELEVAGVFGTPTAEEYAKALAKVSKNLAKDSIFYTNQVAGVNSKVDLHDKMVPVTAKNTVDTFNGMKKAALKEGFKKLIKKVLSENMGDMFGDEEREERRSNYGQPGERDYSNAENYKDEEEEFELQQEETVTESGMGDVYQLAKESDTFEDFVQAIEQEYGPTSDVDELMYIWDNRQGGDIDYNDENFSDPFIDGDDLFEAPEPFLNLKQLHTLAQRAGNFGEDVKEALLSLYNAYEEKTPVSKVKEILANYDLTLRDLKSQPATFSPSREFAHLFNSSEREDSLYEGRKSLSELLK